MPQNKNPIQEQIEAARASSPANGLSNQQIAVKVANEIYKKNNPEFRKNNATKNREQAQDPKWLQANAEKNQRLAKSQEWLTATKQGSLKRKQTSEQLLAEGRIDEHRRLFGYKEQHSKETKKKMSESGRLRWAKIRRRVHTDQGIFLNIDEAGRALGIHKDTVVYRIRSQGARWKEWYYIED